MSNEMVNPANVDSDQVAQLGAHTCRLGVVSDTHGHVPYTLDAIRMLELVGVDVVIHCGDIGSPEIPRLFAKWPTYYVLGNVDMPAAPLRAAIQASQGTCRERFGELDLAGRRVAWLHGDDFDLLDETIAGGRYDLVCHGHTHVCRNERIGKTLVLNPGALYRATPHSLAIVELPKLEPVFLEL